MNHEVLSSTESLRGTRYVDIVHKETNGLKIWDYLGYTREGNLTINGIEVMDLALDGGSPLEITDTGIIEKRAKDWELLTQRVAGEVGYKGGFKYFYAAKANFNAEFTATAYRAGWHAETTSTQDLVNIESLSAAGLFNKSRTEIMCNGFFLNEKYFGRPDPNHKVKSTNLVIVRHGADEHAGEMDYISRMIRMHDQGYKITPIIYEYDELQDLISRGRKFNIGLRLKFGKVDNDRDLARLVSRFGENFDELQNLAALARESGLLTLTTFHAMVGAAENIPVEIFDNSLLFAADKYFILRKDNPELKYFNIGGGITPLGERYDHKKFLRRLLQGLKTKAAEAGLPEPTVVFEQGGPLASEASFDVVKIVHRIKNNIDEHGKPEEWYIGDEAILTTMPDIWFIGKKFLVLAANHANQPAKKVYFSDLTCDGGSVLPGKLLVPNTDEDTYLAICATGAYQNALTGEDGVHHCALYEPKKWILVRKNGITKAFDLGRQTSQDVSKKLHYTKEFLQYFK